MAKEKRITLNPPAELPGRDGDVKVPFDCFLAISFFARLKKRPSLEKFPGALALRRYRRGEIICRQGEAGWTAFYALTSADLLALGLEGESRPGPAAQVATVHLALPRSLQTEGGLLRRLARSLGLAAGRPKGPRPKYIPIDAPSYADYESRQAPLHEGELFGEMSCMYGSPRSGTIVADRDCYLLEMLRNVLDQVQKDPGYQAEMARVYRERVLANHLRRLSILEGLTDEQFERIRAAVTPEDFLQCQVGEVVCDEHDRSDNVYLIRSGLVQVIKNASPLLAVGEVADWAGLCDQLRQAEKEPALRKDEGGRMKEEESSGPTALLSSFILHPSSFRRALAAKALGEESRQELVFGLNDFIKAPPVPDPKSPPQLPESAPLAQLLARLPRDPKQWSGLDRRTFGRLYLEAVLPGALRPLAARAGLEHILTYLSRGDFFGELGVLTGLPRSATCVAFGHPEPGQGQQTGVRASLRKDALPVELVRIPGQLFRQALKESAAVRRKVEAIAAERRHRDVKLQQRPAWDPGREVQGNGAFEELGLIQGQQLMLIDLDRCTRCDECVQACSNTHDDGRSRLFLDGPRFGKYLVPTTCRSCLDPVCLIGCPVGSIHRGDNREILIEDWCIGCGLCARNCPYDAIQMHDIGIIPEESHGWRYCPAAAAKGNWMSPRYSDRRWRAGKAPFRFDREFQASLDEMLPGGGAAAGSGVCFRREFEVSAEALGTAWEFALEVTAAEGPLRVWLNGQEVQPEGPPQRGKRSYAIKRDANILRRGSNVVAVGVTPAGKELEVVLALRLDEVRQPLSLPGLEGDIKVVDERAVVCDLCSGQWGQRPACVTACPHDAALRVNARFEFPAE